MAYQRKKVDSKKVVAEFYKANSIEKTVVDPSKVKRLDIEGRRRDSETGMREPRTEIHFSNTKVSVRHSKSEVLNRLGWAVPKYD